MRTVADSLRTNPKFNTYETLLNLGTGEALISLLGEDGVPGRTEKCKIVAPKTMDLKVTEEEKNAIRLIEKAKSSNIENYPEC